MRVKICGITRPEDAVAAQGAGADAIGLIFGESRRKVDEAAAREVVVAVSPFVTTVGVFRDQPLDEVIRIVTELGLDVAQLHGEETADFASAVRRHARVLRAVPFARAPSPAALEGYPADGYMLDAAVPGSGTSFDWTAARAWRAHPRLVLAGGLTPVNVRTAVGVLQPHAVDVSSGVESAPGIKDHELIQQFIDAAKG